MQPYSLTGPANWTNSTYYTMQVVDLRGTGIGWNVMASASPFTNGLTTGQVQNTNNTQWSGICGPVVVGFCAAPGSFSNGVSSYLTSLNISTSQQLLLSSTNGTAPGPVPNGTGTFTQQSAIYYTGVPAGLAVGTYTTTITLTLTGSEP
ncbi:MAG: hypothetical protein IT334_06905 [Thermomicrobiales bacterium]|nr:hypothetical protein [Thermomicrobiales bacterium]